MAFAKEYYKKMNKCFFNVDYFTFNLKQLRIQSKYFKLLLSNDIWVIFKEILKGILPMNVINWQMAKNIS